MRARWIFLGLLVLLVASAIAFRAFMPASVETAKVRTGPAVEVVYATGFVEVEQPVEVAARVTAPIADIRVREGDRVVPGEVLATLDRADQAAEMERLAAATRFAEMDAARTLPLVEKGFATKAVRDRVRTNLDAARAAERAARERLGYYVLRSSIAGVVLRRDAEAGDLATPTKTLLVLGDPALTKITATIDERDIPRVKVGQTALMSTDAYPGKLFKARVREITLGGDPDQRAFRARLQPLDPVPLPVGLTLEVNIVTREKSGALLVPDSAVVDGAVWQVVDGRARRTPVRTGVIGRDTIEILSGVEDGDTVVAEPAEELEDGVRVRVRVDGAAR